MHKHFPALLIVCTLLAACGQDKARDEARAQGGDALPAPGEVSGSVTGMPNPGAASAPRSAARAPDIIELPRQADAVDDMSGDVALQPPAEIGMPAVPYDQAGPELADAPPAPEAPATTEPPEPTPPPL